MRRSPALATRLMGAAAKLCASAFRRRMQVGHSAQHNCPYRCARGLNACSTRHSHPQEFVCFSLPNPAQSGFGSRQPHSKWLEPDAGSMRSSLELLGSSVARALASQPLHHHRSWPLKKMLLTADIKTNRIGAHDGRTMA